MGLVLTIQEFLLRNGILEKSWIKEVEIANSIDELLTTRSITGRPDFPDYDMLDAMTAPALKKLLNKQSTVPKKE